jgi:hypothetical protein
MAACDCCGANIALGWGLATGRFVNFLTVVKSCGAIAAIVKRVVRVNYMAMAACSGGRLDLSTF